MLVLTRREGEHIILNAGTPEEIRIALVDTDGSRARIGIAAPQHVKIFRSELIERKSDDSQRTGIHG